MLSSIFFNNLYFLKTHSSYSNNFHCYFILLTKISLKNDALNQNSLFEERHILVSFFFLSYITCFVVVSLFTFRLISDLT